MFIPLNNAMNDPDAFTLREPIPAAPYLPHPGPPWWIWALAALGVIAVATVIIVLVHRKKHRSSDPDPEEARRRALAALAGIDASAPPGTVATTVSLLLRRFLAEAFGDPALFETHEEFVSRRHALADLPADQRDTLTRLFATLTKLKYSPVPPDTDTAPLLDNAKHLLTTLTIPRPKEKPNPEQSPPPLPAG